MASWEIRFTAVPGGPYVGRFMAENLSLEIVNSEDGGFTCELPLSATQIDNPSLGINREWPNGFGPKRSDWEIYRSGQLISAGILTSVNLGKDRDTILLAGRDWLWYLKQRVFPFNIEDYVAGDWRNWPKQWPAVRGDPLVDMAVIVRALIKSITIDPATNGTIQGARPITYSVPTMYQETSYSILPGDSTTIFDHIQTLSQRNDGFEFDISPSDLEFRTWAPRRDRTTIDGVVDYAFSVYDPTASDEETIESFGQIVEFDWTNEGPDGTYLVGYGTKEHKVGRIFFDPETLIKFGRYDLVYDYGNIPNYASILHMLRDQQDLYPQKKITLSLLNPEFLPNFYGYGRPRGLIGQRVRVTHDFAPYHKVDAYFRVNSIRWQVDQSTNEVVDLGLEMLYPPDVAH